MFTVISVSNKNYHLASEVAEAHRQKFAGCCGRNIRKIPEKKNLGAEDYIFAKEKEGVWVQSSAEYNRAKLFLAQSWVQNFLAGGMARNTEVLRHIPEPDEKYQECPPTIELTEQDMFRDNEGNTFKIRMVGKRTPKECFFLVRDVAECFEFPRLNNSLCHTDSHYIRDEHFVTFIHNRYEPLISALNKTCLYLTFKGLLKVLFSSRCGKAEKFTDWCYSTLFTSTFGSKEEKTELTAELLSTNVKNLRAVLDKSASNFPAIYLFSIKNKKDVYKFGCTANLSRRSRELTTDHGDIELSQFSYIDPKYIFEAEVSLKTICQRIGRKIEGELVEISGAADMKLIKDQFKLISIQYSGQTIEIQKQLEEAKRQIERNQAELKNAEDKLRIMRERSEEQRHAAEDKLRIMRERSEEHHKLELENLQFKKDMEIMRLQKELEIAELKLKLAAK